MIKVRLVERIEGDWCAFIEGAEENAVSASTDDAALGRLLREQPERFGIEAIGVTELDPGLSGEPAARFPGEGRVVGPESQAPAFRRRSEEHQGRSQTFGGTTN
jgi:hypothetical protein